MTTIKHLLFGQRRWIMTLLLFLSVLCTVAGLVVLHDAFYLPSWGYCGAEYCQEQSWLERMNRMRRDHLLVRGILLLVLGPLWFGTVAYGGYLLSRRFTGEHVTRL